MFIKKDLRKIPKILDDAIECCPNKTNGKGSDIEDHRDKRTKVQAPLSELRLGRRKQEFNGTVQILCQPKYLPKLQNLQSLNLYDCAISNLDGIGTLSECPALEILNLGRNPLTHLPDELSQVQNSLTQIWLDDCQLSGPLPACLLELPNLEILRIPNNQITEVPANITQKLRNLKVLCLDRNQLTSVPDLSTLPKLEELLVRHNLLTQLMKLPTSLKLLHISSNQLTNLNSLVEESHCPQLTHLFANSNQLASLPAGILLNHPLLQRLLVSHNPISKVPDEFWGTTTECQVVWKPNEHLVESTVPEDEGDSEMPPATE
jgi:Leucine-rich repeat (LRR) protein